MEQLKNRSFRIAVWTFSVLFAMNLVTQGYIAYKSTQTRNTQVQNHEGMVSRQRAIFSKIDSLLQIAKNQK